MKRKKYNENYFEQIDNENKAYWLGFIYADGYVRKKLHSAQFKLKLSKNDKSHIEALKMEMESSNEIEDGIEYFIKNNKQYESRYSMINIYSVKLVNDLINVGCFENKTQKIRLPHLNPNLMYHFIRGYFDGDGCIYKVKNRPNSFVITIVSNDVFIIELQNFLNMGKIYKYQNYSILNISKINEVKNFRDLIYKNASIFLKRKKEKFDKINNEFRRDYSLTRNKKEYMVISPDGEEILVKNLRRFCDENNIVFSTMSNLSRGIGKTSKGWKCKQFNNI